MKTYKQFIKEGLTDKMKSKSDEEVKVSLSKLDAISKIENIRDYNLDVSYIPTEEEIRKALSEMGILHRISKIEYLDLGDKYLPTDEDFKKDFEKQLGDYDKFKKDTLIEPLTVYKLITGITKPGSITKLSNRSDVSIISTFARNNNISLEELKAELKKYTELSKYTVKVWTEVIDRILDRRRVKPNLETELSGGQYGAYITNDNRYNNGKYIVQILQKGIDVDGEFIGSPNTEYWSETPASYYADTFLGWDEYGSGTGDEICIDGGQNWTVYGANALRKEIEEKYGKEIKSKL